LYIFLIGRHKFNHDAQGATIQIVWLRFLGAPAALAHGKVPFCKLMTRFPFPLAVAVLAVAFAQAREPSPPSKPEIILDQASRDIFPEAWRSSRVNASAEPLLDDQAERLRGILDRALGKYPPALLGETLQKVYGLGHLEYHGVATGGTRSKSSIYVVCKPRFSDTAVERIIHGEYSSILFLRFSEHFDQEAWQKVHPPEFEYLGSGVAAVKAGKSSSKLKQELHETGFLHDYSQASIEEDFNSHATLLLTGDEDYWRAVEAHPKLRAKAELVMGFYAKMDSSFTAEKFAELRTNPAQLTLARIFTDKEFEEEKMETFQWSKLGAYYFALEKPAEGEDGKDLVRHDAATGNRAVIVSAQEFTPKDAKKPLTISDFTFSKDEQRLLIFTNTRKVWRRNTRGDYWLLDLPTKRLTKLGGDAPASTMMFAKFSPDGTRAAYVRKNNIHVQDLADLKITQLTADGSDKIINGTSDWVNEEELGLRDCFRWSPDGARILFWQFDTSDVKRFWLVNQTEGAYQRFTTFPYPKAGETNSATRLGVVNASGGKVTWIQTPGDPREHYLPSAEWTPGGGEILVQQFNRLQNTLRVMLADPATGGARPLFTEIDEAWVENRNREPRWTGDDSFLWLSERDGWRRVYRANLAGEFQSVTPEKQDVIEITALDKKGGWLYYLASPGNATQRDLHRSSLDGKRNKQLTPSGLPGTHSYEVSTDSKWAVHTHSSVTTPPVVSLVSLPKHESARVLKDQKALKEKLAKLELPKTRFTQVDIGGGLLADAWMMTGADFDPKKRHPLLMHVYGEPAGQTVRDAWGGQRFLWHAMLAQQGYVVASVDTRGTPAPKGRAWRKAVYRQLGVINSREQAEALRSLLTQHGFLDPKRVGIWGWSGGGSSSLDAIFRYPELYRAAIAVAPVPDRKLYDTIYEERYMGLPEDNEEGYKDGSPITHATKLEGNLLIIHGTGDDNVHYQGVEKLMDELIAHNKPFTIMPYPNRDHSINTGKGTSRHLYELMTAWLHQHLPVP
jgi:dipeptidyl-peptidase-4